VLLLNESVSIIKKESPFLDYIASLHLPTVIEDFDRNKAIKEVFTESCMRKMTVFWIYPFQISGDLLGFICVFRLSDYQLKDLQFDNFRSLSDVILTHYWSSRLIEYQYTNYIDVIVPVFNRISKELNNASKLSIPLTIVLFTIKNLKRYYIIQGFNKTKELIDKVEDIIRNRLSEGDFTAKIDRHKFLIVLPGKNKKFAVPFANALKNEIVQQFSQKELQLLVTFLMAEYPEDGNDMYSLLDAID
jgi:GGDEF domain-containing protein